MQAVDAKLTTLLEGAKQFIIPVFQRDYSWGTKHCLQLWSDIVRVGSDPTAKAHFIGSVVYIAAEETSASITRWLLIDGQQRLTTLVLLLAALRNKLPAGGNDQVHGEEQDGLPSRSELEDYFLRNRHGKGDRRLKLHLRRADYDTLLALIDGRDLPPKPSRRIRENFAFFEEQLASADLGVVYRGVRKLVAVDVSLTRGQDDPQLIFESLNSTGLDLTQADLIRNFILMGLDEQTQTRLYEDYWRPMETAFGSRYGTDFDKFIRDYLALKLRASKQFKSDDIYQQFRKYFQGLGPPDLNTLLKDLRHAGEEYAAFSFGQEPDLILLRGLTRLRQLVEVASPCVLRLYECHRRLGSLTRDDFVEAALLLESYVFRRSICDMQTRSLWQIFASLAYRIDPAAPLLSLKIGLKRLQKKRRFPTDSEFREALTTRDVYDMVTCKYLLDRLENDSKEKADTTDYTIEHVMPQNPELPAEWRAMLGPDWKRVQDTWLHRLGNLTLTGYNSEYQDRPFTEKKSMRGGFNESPLRLNKFIREQSAWTERELAARSVALASHALAIWPALTVDEAAVRRAELADRKARAANYGPESLEVDPVARVMLDFIRERVQAFGSDVVELWAPKAVTYRVFDFFVQILPRRGRLIVMLNLEMEDVDKGMEQAFDPTTYAFIPGSTESAGAAFSIREAADIPAALKLMRKAYDRVSE